MRINLMNNKYINFDRYDILILLCDAEKIDDEELFNICNTLHATIFNFERENKMANATITMDTESPLCQFLIKKYLDNNPVRSLRLGLEAEEIINTLLYAITSNDCKYIDLLTKIVQNRDYENYDEFKSKYGEDVIEYIRKHAFYNYTLNEHEYPNDGMAYLLVEDEKRNDYHLEQINLLDPKGSILSRSKKND